MSGFIQIIDYSTNRIDELDALLEELIEESDGLRLVTRSVETQDRDRPGHYMTIVEFDSYEDAMANSNDATVSKFAERFARLAEGPPTFYNLDVRSTRVPTD